MFALYYKNEYFLSIFLIYIVKVNIKNNKIAGTNVCNLKFRAEEKKLSLNLRIHSM